MKKHLFFIITFCFYNITFSQTICPECGCFKYYIQNPSKSKDSYFTYIHCITGETKTGSLSPNSYMEGFTARRGSLKPINNNPMIIKEQNESPEPNPTISGSNIICKDSKGVGSITLDGFTKPSTLNAPPRKYQWFKDGKIMNGETNSYLVVSNIGKYYCRITSDWASMRSTLLTSNTIDVNKIGVSISSFTIKADSLNPVKSSLLTPSPISSNLKLTFQWIKEDSSWTALPPLPPIKFNKSLPIPKATNSTYRTFRNGIYSLIASNSSGCSTKSTNKITIAITPKKRSSFSREVSELSKINYYEIFPNPNSTNTLNLNSNNEYINTLRIFDINGKEIKNINVKLDRSISIDDIDNGTYIISIYDNDNNILNTQRFIKE